MPNAVSPFDPIQHIYIHEGFVLSTRVAVGHRLPCPPKIGGSKLVNGTYNETNYWIGAVKAVKIAGYRIAEGGYRAKRFREKVNQRMETIRSKESREKGRRRYEKIERN